MVGMRNVDSKIHFAPIFDCCAFLFYSFFRGGNKICYKQTYANQVRSLTSVRGRSEYIQIMSNNHIAFVSVPDFIQQLTLRVRKRC